MSYSILLVDSDPNALMDLQKVLRKETHKTFAFQSSYKALDFLKNVSADVVISDQEIQGVRGIEFLREVHKRYPDTICFMLAGNATLDLAIEAVNEEAVSRLFTKPCDSSKFTSAINDSFKNKELIIGKEVEKRVCQRTKKLSDANKEFEKDILEYKEMEKKFSDMLFNDELTGLYNRRGFLNMAEQQIKMAVRTQTERFLLFADLDNMKFINDNFGHNKGDEALVSAASIFKETFRDSDIVARIGGDEFTVFFASGVDTMSPQSRLEENIEKYNNSKDKVCKLEISIGLSRYNPRYPSDITELLSEADALMYQQKQNKKKILRQFVSGINSSNSNFKIPLESIRINMLQNMKND